MSKNYLLVSIEKFGNVILKTVGMIILARVLSPNDFGLYGMVFILVGLGNVIVDSGMGGAIIKKNSPTDIDYSTILVFNVIVSILLWILISLASPMIADFYSEPELESVVKLLGLTLIIRSFAITPVTKLTKSLNFRVQIYITSSSYLIAFIIGLILATKGYGVYALVYISLIESLFTSILSYIAIKSLPKFRFSMAIFKEHYRFGSRLMCSSIIKITYESSIGVIFGKFYGAYLLGLYSQANKVNEIFINTSSTIIDKVTFPILSAKLNKGECCLNYMRKLLVLVVFFSAFICTQLSFSSEQIIKILLGNKWVESSEILKIISFAGIGMLIEGVSRSFLKAHGLAGLILNLELQKRLISICTILLIIPFGVHYILISYVILTVASALINMIYLGTHTRYKFKRQIADLWFIGVAFCLLNIALKWGSEYHAFEDIFKIAFGLIFSVIIYFPLNYLYYRKQFNLP
ncbi:lipopolysaccharide biosynthesis protein [Vibrio breoganii]|uniref:lipopolysaccharide biosynthesis protein n=1 Tax=Vibrio breoganii TaxID=553239 RepID=UPI000C8655AA|nr:lipopolysaccharide biosynthesis protein [Vibrio breoganii]PMM86132.1 hypothetical protein BCT44_06860 [Vibrio breoganii]